MGSERQMSPTVRRKMMEAELARDALAMALRRAGIQFPAMDVQGPLGAGEGGYGLVLLGACSAPVVQKLAAVISRGASR